MRLLVIKLGALGDVLRTTALLPPFLKQYPGAEVWWVTSQAAAPLLDGNPAIARVLTPESLDLLGGCTFQWAWSMEEDRGTAILREKLRCDRWTGVIYERGRLAYTPDSEPYYSLSLLNVDADGSHSTADRLKQENRRSFESIWLEALGLGYDEATAVPHLVLSAHELEVGADVLRQVGGLGGLWRVAINPSAGGRWPAKRIPMETVREIARGVHSRWSVPLLLLGGAEEDREHRAVAEGSGGNLIYVGSHPLRKFASIVAHCDVVVTSDSLCLHIAKALGCGVVAGFGPTSSHEITIPRGSKIGGDSHCACWYAPRCRQMTSCLARHGTEAWLGAIADLLPAP